MEHLALKTISEKSLLLWACFSAFTEIPLFKYFMTNITICTIHCLTLFVYNFWQEMLLAPAKVPLKVQPATFKSTKMAERVKSGIASSTCKKADQKAFWREMSSN